MSKQLPTPAENNPADRRLAYSIFLADCCLALSSRVRAAYSSYLSVSQLGATVSLTAQPAFWVRVGTVPLSACSTLAANSISSVVRIGTSVQVLRAHARWVIASVQYIQANWDRTDLKRVSQPVDSILTTLKRQAAIAARQFRALPSPTQICFQYTAPQPFGRYIFDHQLSLASITDA